VKRMRLVAVVVAAALCTALVSTGVTGAGAQGSVRGVTDTEIKVAGLVQASQFASADVEIGAKAAFDAAGPINGRTINYSETADDKADASTNLSEARRLVQQEQVFGIVPVLTPVLGPAADFLEQQKVPTVGWAIAEAFCDKDYLFGFTGCIVPPDSIPNTGDTWGKLLDAAYKAQGDSKGAKGKTAAVITEDNDTGKKGNIEIAFQAKKAGFKVTYKKASLPAPPAVVGDYSPFVSDILSSNGGQAPDAVFVVTSFPNVLGMDTALKAANFTGVITNAVIRLAARGPRQGRLGVHAVRPARVGQPGDHEDRRPAQGGGCDDRHADHAGRVLLGRHVRQDREEGG